MIEGANMFDLWEEKICLHTHTHTQTGNKYIVNIHSYSSIHIKVYQFILGSLGLFSLHIEQLKALTERNWTFTNRRREG